MKIDQDERDHRLDHLLAALGKAEIDPEFEARVLHGVEQRQGRRAQRPEGSSAWSWRLAAGLACAMVFAGVMVQVKVRQGASREPQVLRPRVAGPVAPAAVVPDVRAQVKSAPRAARLVATTNRNEPANVPATQPEINVPEAQVSFPAPPMPLTEQERLMLKIVHKGDPVEMAMLDPAVREKMQADELAEYKEFFKPPPLPVDDDSTKKEPKEEKKGETR